MQVSVGGEGRLGQAGAWLPRFLGSCQGQHGQTSVPSPPLPAKVTADGGKGVALGHVGKWGWSP